MKTRKEIEEYLKSQGIEIESHMEEYRTTEYGEDVIDIIASPYPGKESIAHWPGLWLKGFLLLIPTTW